MITLKDLNLRASVDPMEKIYEQSWFVYPSHPPLFRRPANPAHCDLQIFGHRNGKLRVAIATELENNDGASITNASEQLASAICKLLFIDDPENLILVEHYEKDSILEEHWDLVRFKFVKGSFSSPQWIRLDKKVLEDLLGENCEHQLF